MTVGCLSHFCKESKLEFTDRLSHTWHVQTEKGILGSLIKLVQFMDIMYQNLMIQ